MSIYSNITDEIRATALKPSDELTKLVSKWVHTSAEIKNRYEALGQHKKITNQIPSTDIVASSDAETIYNSFLEIGKIESTLKEFEEANKIREEELISFIENILRGKSFTAPVTFGTDKLLLLFSVEDAGGNKKLIHRGY